MARQTKPDLAAAQQKMGINSGEIAACRRDRDFTNLLDLKHEFHTTFIRKLRAHVETFYTWRDLRQSAKSRSSCIEQFLDIHGPEYWGGKNRERYIMSDSVARDDDVRLPEDRGE